MSWFYKSLGSHPFLLSCHLIRLCKFCDTRLVCLAGLFSCITNNSAVCQVLLERGLFPCSSFLGFFFCKACVYRVQWTLAARRPVWGNVMNSLILWVVSNSMGLWCCIPARLHISSQTLLSFCLLMGSSFKVHKINPCFPRWSSGRFISEYSLGESAWVWAKLMLA
jgi:hypothetical protein